MIDHQTQLNLVIGNPLTHTQSPLLHNRVYALLNCNAVLLAHETKNLSETVRALKTLSIGFAAVTIPYKAGIVSYLDDKSPDVEKMGVANTVILRDGKLMGYNTDIDGVAHAFRNISVVGKKALIIGAGGASDAIACYLANNHADLLWLNRTREKALAHIKKWGGECVDRDALEKRDIDIIINTTPIGMFPDMSCSPLPNYDFQPNQIVFDMVYNPVETLFLKQAREKNATCISGLDMFIGQGLKQIELWLNRSIVTPELILSLQSLLIHAQTARETA
ncbi:MAG TPA: shikimate dehydrogenase [Gammaproteobacteria bacterium]|nr:shikimate dehydrogenase [Gammaproteobacteria bacterium]